MNREELLAKIVEFPYWYHAIDLGNGIVTPGWAPIDASKYGIPDRMDGETVLDVGAWDGFWTFEALKRGAKHVTAIDDFSDTCGEITNADRSKAWATFDLCAEALGVDCVDSKCLEYCLEDEIQDRTVIKFNNSVESDFIGQIGLMDGDPIYQKWDCGLDYKRVFCFGVLYHLKNPVKALQNLFDAMKSSGFIHIETAILDNITSPYTGQPHDANGCYAEFYPTNEFGRNQSNWWVPTLKCARAWLQAAGFVDIESWKLTETPNSVAECRGFLRARKP